jgi:hypothetical protein
MYDVSYNTVFYSIHGTLDYYFKDVIVFNFDDRLKDDHLGINIFYKEYKGVELYCIVDSTECQIERPCYEDWDYQYMFFSGYKNYHSLKYSLGSTIYKGYVVFVDGPELGPTDDLKILEDSKQEILLKLKEKVIYF